MSDEKERNEVGEVTDQLIDRQGEGEPDFEGHRQGNDGDADRQGEGEPDFEGHRWIERQADRQADRQSD